MGLVSKKSSNRSNQDQVDKPTQKRDAFLRTAATCVRMGTAIKANDAGYKTASGYVRGAGGTLVNMVAGLVSHAPADVKATNKDLIQSAARLYDEGRAFEHPETVLNFKPSPIPQETIDKNTLVLEDRPDDFKICAEYALAEKGYSIAYEKGDLITAKEYQEKMDKAYFEAKEQKNKAEQEKMSSEARSKEEKAEKTRR